MNDTVNQTFHDVLAPFYRQALTVNSDTGSTEVLERVLADHFVSINRRGTKDKATLIRQVALFWELIPDLRWEPQEKVVEGQRVVVRSIASGTPRGRFLGLELDGTRRFEIDTIDIHTVEDGRIVRAYHLEDWGAAIEQLRG